MRFLSTLLVASLATLGLAAPNPQRGSWYVGKYPNKSVDPSNDASPFGKIAGEYIIVLNSSVTTDEFDAIEGWTTEVFRRNLQKRGGVGFRGIKHKWRGGRGRFNGYSGQFDDDTIAEIKSHSEVQYVEQASRVTIQEYQLGAPWGIARVSKAYNDLTTEGGARYNFDRSSGNGATVYVIDTGINVDHVEFEGRAIHGAALIEGSPLTDAHGHGTHVAATIVGKTYGVAKRATVVNLRVLDDKGTGSNADVVEAIDWALKHAEENNVKVPIINMSLGGEFSQAVNDRVRYAVEVRGALVVAAAGNQGKDASGFSPASSEFAITVGATDYKDVRADFSNFGTAVDIFAPGVNILSATVNVGGINTNSEFKLMKGTSMAAPHVAGVAAYFAGKGYDRNAVRDLIFSKAHNGIVQDTLGSANRLVFNGFGKKF